MFAVPAVLVHPRISRHEKLGLPFAVAGLFMLAVVGLRYEVGPDWIPYLYIFQRISLGGLEAVVRFGDVGFSGLMWAVDRIGGSIWLVNLICAAVFTIGLVEFARRQVSPWLTVAVGIPYLVIVVAMSATRQATAIGFLMLALVAFYDNRLWRAGFWVFCASLFHASAILMAGIAAISYTRSRLQSMLLLLVMAIPAYYLLSSNLEVYISRYSQGGIQSSGAGLRVMMNFIPAVIYFLFSRHFPDSPHVRALWRNLAWLAVACVPLLFLFPSSTAVDRLALYAIPLQMYVFSRLPVAIDPKLSAYRTWAIAIVGYLALVQYVFLNYSSHREYWREYAFYPVFDSSSARTSVGRVR